MISWGIFLTIKYRKDPIDRSRYNGVFRESLQCDRSRHFFKYLKLFVPHSIIKDPAGDQTLTLINKIPVVAGFKSYHIFPPYKRSVFQWTLCFCIK